MKIENKLDQEEKKKEKGRIVYYGLFTFYSFLAKQ